MNELTGEEKQWRRDRKKEQLNKEWSIFVNMKRHDDDDDENDNENGYAVDKYI